MQRCAILLDFDGVVLKNHPSHRYVAKQCEAFVQKYIKSKDAHVIHTVNKGLYQSSGHTVLGLRKMGYDVSFDEFNDYVYSKVKYCRVFDYLYRYHTQDCQELMEFCERYKRITKYGPLHDALGIYIASNAPDEWCFNILENMGIDMSIIQRDGFSSYGYVKPQSEFYDIVRNRIDADKYIFVDDSISNLLPIANDDQWTSCWMIGDGSGDIVNITKNMYKINKLSDVFDVKW